MKDIAYYNGKIGRIDEVQAPITDRGLYFGDGVYDATYSRNHKIYNLDAHINRFFNSAKLLEINIPHTKEEMKEILSEMVRKVDDGEQFVYWQVTRGTGIRNHAFSGDDAGNIWIMLKPAKVKDTYEKIRLITLEDTRFYHCNIKTLNLIPSVLANQRAVERGCDEAVLHRGSRVTECAHSNISMLKDGVLHTAPADELILPGITRKSCIQVLRDKGVKVEERRLSVDELGAACEQGRLREAFGCGTAAVVSPIGELRYKDQTYRIHDGRIGELTQMLYDTLTGIQWGKLPDPYGWILPIE